MRKGSPKQPRKSSKDENKNPKKDSDLKIKGLTLIKISNGKVSEYITGEDKIEEYLK